MRLLVTVILLFTLAGTGFWYYTYNQAASNAAVDNIRHTDAETGSAAATTATNNTETSLMQQAMSHVRPLFDDADSKPALSTPAKPPISLDDLNLELPVTVHPTTPALQLPDNKTLILPVKKDQPAGVSVGGGIDWDDKEEKAKGAKITITIPTG